MSAVITEFAAIVAAIVAFADPSNVAVPVTSPEIAILLAVANLVAVGALPTTDVAILRFAEPSNDPDPVTSPVSDTVLLVANLVAVVELPVIVPKEIKEAAVTLPGTTMFPESVGTELPFEDILV
jgi:hypothetical protein